MHFFVADTLLLNPAPTEAALAVTRDVAGQQALMCGPGSIATSGLDSRTAGFTARDDGDALVVNGKAGFASMSEGATYVFLSGTVDRGEGVEPDLFFATPRHDTPGIKNLRNWDGMGFRGTASHDIQLEDARISKSEALVVPATFFQMLGQISATLPAPVRQGRAVGTLGILAIWLGLSRAALDFTRDYVEQRYGGTAFQTPAFAAVGLRADDAWAQIQIGEMAHWVETGKTILYDFTSRLDTPFPSGDEFNRALGIVIYHLRRMSEEVAMGSMKVCGAHAYVKNRPLERIYRDLTGCVVMAWKTGLLAQQIGLATLGRPFVVGGPIAAS
jgi:alkylation response protein AidB-like acyl-CoA dehydrogenase